MKQLNSILEQVNNKWGFEGQENFSLALKERDDIVVYYFVPKNLNPGASSCTIAILCDGLTAVRWCTESGYPDQLMDAPERTMTVKKNGTYTVELTAANERLVTQFSVFHLRPNQAFTGGDGSQASPYLISNCAQFNRIRSNLHAHYRLISDLDFEREMKNLCWIPIGNYSQREPKIDPNIPWEEQDIGYRINYGFTGELDGGGHTISGLVCIQTKVTYLGLFGSCGDSAYIHHVNLKNCSFDGKDESAVGTIAGRTEKATIERCLIAETSIENGLSGGGIVGEANAGTIIQACQFVGTMVSRDIKVLRFGGIAGTVITKLVRERFKAYTADKDGTLRIEMTHSMEGVTIEDCCVKADLLNCEQGSGIACSEAHISRCFFSGTIRSTERSAGIVVYRAGHMPDACVCAQAQICHSNSDVPAEQRPMFVNFYNESGVEIRNERVEDAWSNHCGRITCDDHTLEPQVQHFSYCAPSCILCTLSGQHAAVENSLRDGTTVPEAEVHNPDFYRSLGWDFKTIWEIGEDGLPQVRRTIKSANDGWDSSSVPSPPLLPQSIDPI